ncbi:class A beta-lactamase [Niallia sp. JL1B1071]|uniref:class A beta-lactamase n=1 Tax=Niallia tiangongensis TaxID=3237105 RepID=UPI0037DC31BE
MDDFIKLEREFNARLGVFAIDMKTEKKISYRGDERFAFASTYKALAVGALLLKKSLKDLEQIITFRKEDLVTYSPITVLQVENGMTLKEIAAVAICYSDNTAGNILLKELGGPFGFERALRDIGDMDTMSNRFEPDLNDTVPGDLRDTSTPRALATSFQAFTTSDLLPDEKQALLNGWLRENTTGDTLIRAGIPEGLDIGDKSGAASFGTRNDLAIVWPPDNKTIVIAILSCRNTKNAKFADALIAKTAKMIIKALL